MKRSIVTVGSLIAAPVVLYFLAYLWFIFYSPLSTSEMDLNKNGWVEFMEAEYAANYGVRNIVRDGKTCVEYFAYKDGLPIKLMCNDKL